MTGQLGHLKPLWHKPTGGTIVTLDSSASSLPVGVLSGQVDGESIELQGVTHFERDGVFEVAQNPQDWVTMATASESERHIRAALISFALFLVAIWYLLRNT